MYHHYINLPNARQVLKIYLSHTLQAKPHPGRPLPAPAAAAC